MTRNISVDASDHVEGEVIRFAILLELQLDSGDVNLWSGVGDLFWNAKTWTGVGAMGSISGVTEASDLSDTTIKATLSHVPTATLPDFVIEFTDNDPVGRPFELHLALLNPDNTIDDVITLSAGFVDAVSLADGEEGAINIDLASEAALLQRTRAYRLSAQHQEALFTGDLGLEFVTNLDEEIRWGSATPQKVRSGGANVGLDFSSSPIEVGGVKQF